LRPNNSEAAAAEQDPLRQLDEVRLPPMNLLVLKSKRAAWTLRPRRVLSRTKKRRRLDRGFYLALLSFSTKPDGF